MGFPGFSYLFRKHVVLRFCVLIAVCAAAVSFLFFFTLQSKQEPLIQNIDPAAGSPGDILTITGSFFGDERGESYIEIANNRLTASSYISWNDTRIQAVLPPNVGDGLVYVITPNGKSEPKIFADRTAIPVQVRPDPQTGLPVIQAIQERRASAGNIITITGRNFGPLRNTSQVFFTWQGDGGTNRNITPQNVRTAEDEISSFIACSEQDFDYEFWSDQEIRVRVPDGAASGPVYVVTEKGASNHTDFEISNAGTKQYTDRRTYVVSLSADISNPKTQGETMISLRVPRPPVTAAQRSVLVSASEPEPVVQNHMNTMIHQIENIKDDSTFPISHSFVITTYDIRTQIQPSRIKGYTDKNRLLYVRYTQPDDLIKPEDERVTQLLPSILKREQNPYLQAKAIYNYILSEFAAAGTPVPANNDPLDALETKQADAYDMAVLFCTFARAAGIPALPVSGILLDKNQKSRVHWWCEFYIENVGWIPADPGLGAGLPYEPFQEKEDPADFYFGNLDGQHIIFSRGWNNLRPMTPNSKTVYRPRTYGLQSIWEEADGTIESYTSHWSDPVVTGIY